MWGYKKKVCAYMIQPVSAFNPQAAFRGPGDTKKSQSNTKINRAALINAGCIATAVGGLTTAVARSYMPSWSQSVALGFCATVASVFFMTPQIVKKFLHRNGKDNAVDAIVNEPIRSSQAIKNRLKPAFKQS